MDTLSFLKECLLTYNYPLVHSMSEEEFADIFKTSNRCFLISWMLKLLDSAYEEVLANSENDKELLSNIIYELGFCTKKEKLPFMSGGLTVPQQVKIIYNLFKYLSDIKKSDCKENETNVTNSDLSALENIDLNLFPMYGEMKLLNLSERNLKLSELEREIDAWKTENSVNAENKDSPLLDGEFKEDIQEFIDKLKQEFPRMKSAMEDVIKNKDIEGGDNKVIELKPDSVETLKKCCQNLRIISQFINDINTIEDFERHDFGIGEENVKVNSTFEMIKMLHREVLATLKYL